MPRHQFPKRPVAIDYQCDVCGEGWYRPTNIMLTSSPPQFPHECNKCGDKQVFTEKYPTVRLVNEGEIVDLENYQQSTL